MKVSANRLKRMIREEISLLMEGCGDAVETGSDCSACSAGLECPCGDNLIGLDDVGQIDDETEDGLFSRDEALRIVSAIAQNTSCSVTRAALMDVVEDLGEDEGEEWSISGGDDESVDVDWSNPQYGQFKGDIDNLESKDDAFGTGFVMGQSGDFQDSTESYGRG